jgi:hypothetical protein
VAHQGPVPPRSGRPSAAPGGGPRWADRDYPDDGDEELPPWAGLAVDPRWADGTGRGKRAASPRRAAELPPDPAPGPAPEEPAVAPRARPRGRQAAARARRTRRSIHLWGTVLVVAAVLGGGIWWLVGRGSGPVKQPDAIITTFQPGEFQTVPNVCSAVTGATLGQYLPGKRTLASPASLDGGAASLCSWTLDARPLYRLLNVQVQAYSPNGLASGDGSATFAAIDAFAQAQQQKAHPAKRTRLPAAAMTTLRGLGSKAFAAVQQTRGGGITTDLVTVVVRDRNVVITAVLEGDTGRGGYGPVSPAQLQAGAEAAARDVLAHLK